MKHTFFIIGMLAVFTATAQEYPFVSWSGQRGVPRDIITDIVQDHRGFIWVATAEHGVLRLDGKEIARPDDATRSLPQSVFALATDGSNHLFVGGNRGVTVIRLGSTGSDSVASEWNAILKDIRSPVRSLNARPGKDLYIETSEGCYRLRFRDSTLTSTTPQKAPHAFLASMLPGYEIRDMARDCRGRYWVATDRGLLLKDDEGSALFGPPQGLHVKDVRSVFVDREANIWIGSSSGLQMHTPGRVTNFTDGVSLPDGIGAVHCLLETGDRGILLGTAAGGIIRILDGVIAQYLRKDGLPSNTVNCLLQLPTGDVLVGTDSGMAILHETGLVETPPELRMPGTRVTAMLASSDQKFWIGSDAGLLQWNGETMRVFNRLDGLPSARITALHEGPFGKVWVGTRSGLAQVLSTRTADVQVLRELRGRHIRDIHFDTKDRLWVATATAGLFVRGKKDMLRLTERDGLASNAVSFIAEDNYGGLYFGGNRGISVLPRGNVQYLMQVDSSISAWRRIPFAQLPFLRATAMHTLSTGQGFAATEFPPGAAIRDHAGRMWFGSIRGVSSYNPPQPLGMGRWVPPICRDVKKPSRDRSHPSILLREVCINDTCTDARKGVELGKGDHVLRMRVLLPSFRNPGQVSFLYRLQGMEYTWHRSDDGRILYTGLQPGSYMLAVQADIGEGVWTRRRELLEVTVTTPLYESPWFWSALLLILFVLSTLLLRARYQRRLRQEQQILMELQTRLQNN